MRKPLRSVGLLDARGLCSGGTVTGTMTLARAFRPGSQSSLLPRTHCNPRVSPAGFLQKLLWAGLNPSLLLRFERWTRPSSGQHMTGPAVTALTAE